LPDVDVELDPPPVYLPEPLVEAKSAAASLSPHPA